MKIDLSNLLCYKLFKVVKLNEQFIDKEMALFQLSRTQWKILARFNFLSTPCTQQELLVSMGIDQGHLARALDQLEQRDLLIRKRPLTDRRAYHIFLTESGRQLLKQIEQILKTESDALTQGLDKSEVVTLHKLINKIETNILSQLETSS